MKRSVITLLVFLVLLSNHASAKPAAQTELVKLSETYELANIILALTPYGKADQWEVYQKSDYYKEVIAYFDKYKDHPLLAKVNYSREKWESYLSFRTDAYAFSFDKDGQIKRVVDFYANKGFNPFDENLQLINDFVQVSSFRKFYAEHKSYLQTLSATYLQSQKYPEMMSFLQKEFGSTKQKAKYAIVISPLVYRMNCHRPVAGIQTDFSTLPEYLLNKKTGNAITEYDIASGTHMLFTELDHGFVNPASYTYRVLLGDNFKVSKWDKGSGYEKDSLATFNEYMTWGVHNLFVKKYFPEVAVQVNKEWVLQNETRGFYASSLFNRELEGLYDSANGKKTIKELYPQLIKRLAVLQADLTNPVMSNCDLNGKTIQDTVAVFVFHFSEPLEQVKKFDLLTFTNLKGATNDVVVITPNDHQLTWSDNGKTLSFKLHLVSHAVNTVFLNHRLCTLPTLKSLKGVDLQPYTMVKTTVN